MLEHFRKNWVRYIVSVLIITALLLFYVGIRNGWNVLMYYGDGLFIGGYTVLCIGGLSIVNNLGGFDIYQAMFIKKGKNAPRKTLYEFSEEKKQKRAKFKYCFVPYVAVGLISILIAIFLK